MIEYLRTAQRFHWLIGVPICIYKKTLQIGITIPCYGFYHIDSSKTRITTIFTNLMRSMLYVR